MRPTIARALAIAALLLALAAAAPAASVLAGSGDSGRVPGTSVDFDLPYLANNGKSYNCIIFKGFFPTEDPNDDPSDLIYVEYKAWLNDEGEIRDTSDLSKGPRASACITLSN